jgi:hypothetical protein
MQSNSVKRTWYDSIEKHAELSVLPFGISRRLWIPLTDQGSEIKHFYVSIFWLTPSGISSRDDTHVESRR